MICRRIVEQTISMLVLCAWSSCCCCCWRSSGDSSGNWSMERLLLEQSLLPVVEQLLSCARRGVLRTKSRIEWVAAGRGKYLFLLALLPLKLSKVGIVNLISIQKILKICICLTESLISLI